MRVVRAATKSDEKHALSKVGLEEFLEKIEAMGSSTAPGDGECKPCPKIEEFEPDSSTFTTDAPDTDANNDGQTETQYNAENNDAKILSPPISKNKGSKNKQTTNPKPAAALRRKKEDEEEQEYDTDGENVTNCRKCGVCNKKRNHNARSCPALKPKEDAEGTTPKGTLGKKRRRICQGCHKMIGHNILTCPVVKDALAIAKAMQQDESKNKSKKKIKKEIDSDEEPSDEDAGEDEGYEEEDDQDDEEEDNSNEEDEEEDEVETTPPKRRSTRRK